MGLRFVIALVVCLGGCAAPREQCSINSDCHGGAYCYGGNCQVDCRADYDCAGGVCLIAIGKCVAGSPDAGADHDTERDMAIDTHGIPWDLSIAPQAPIDLATPAEPSALPYGDVCEQNGDCDSKLCSQNPFVASDHECTGDCNQGCMLSDFCVAGAACAQSDIGASCSAQKGGTDCRAGACLGGGASPTVCTRNCQSAADCPAGYSCSSVMGTRVCVPLDGTPPCFDDGDCWYLTSCDEENQRCLGGCRNGADCPLWHVCAGGLCTPNKALGAGGIGDPCISGDDCRAGFCAGGTCPGACGVTADKGQYCPGGWGCNPVDTGAGYTLACLPSGSGSVGDPCQPKAGNVDCASGLCITDDNNASYCTRFCNDAPCPTDLPHCAAVGIVADGVTLKACTR